MGIEEDIALHLPSLLDRSVEEKSRFAYHTILGRFDQITEELVAGQGVTDYVRMDVIPPSLRELVRDYTARNDVPGFIRAVYEMKATAERYLRSNGCDPDITMRSERIAEEASEKRCGRLDGMFARVDRMLAEMTRR